MVRNHLWVGGVAALILGSFSIATTLWANEGTEIDYRPDVTYATVAGEELKLDLVRPKELDHAVPAIVVIHGGGWLAGKRQDMTSVAKEVAAHGYVAATISYRLAPKHRFPAQIEDSKCAVRYLRAHADELNVDPTRIGAYGVSAGAHLAMMLGALDPADAMEGDGGNLEQPSKVQAVVSFVGPVNLAGENYTPTQVQILSAFLGGDPKEKQAECRSASPITYLNKGDAPVLCFFGTKDPLVSYDQALQIATALTNSGVPGRVEMILGAGHGWGGKERIRTDHATMAFFDEHLKK
ncbi:MAG TPA: alpha/beta hydrolase [Pirellulales bacterium]|nr:alpha/beta hydrolase [Pirellulales bacterium]